MRVPSPTTVEVKATVVIPCFNEERRIQEDALLRICGPSTKLLMVNDGSTDGTEARLLTLAASHPGCVEVLSLPRNVGKGEAVRSGLKAAIAGGATVVGYFDADLATPPDAMAQLIELVTSGQARFAMAARVALLGRDIQRSVLRHYLGRVFASLASISLGMRVYDTQCGAKAMRVDECLRSCLAEPFKARWAFDVELIMRLTQTGCWHPQDFLELPLQRWTEVGGSKLTRASMLRAAAELATLSTPALMRRTRAALLRIVNRNEPLQ